MMLEHITENTVIVPGFLEQLLVNSDLLAHIRECPECREILFSYALYLQSRQEGFPRIDSITKNKILKALGEVRSMPNLPNDSFLWRRMRSLLAYTDETLVAASGQNADQQQQEASMQNGYLYFTAKCEISNPHYWRAKIAIPVQPNKETILRIHLYDGKGNAIPDGVFHLCGLALPIKHGMALLSLSEFHKNINIPMVSLEYSGGLIEDGQPSLFETDEP